MKSLLTAVLGVMSIALFSCQKEVKDIFSNNGSTGGGSTGSGLLTKITSNNGTDSATLSFTYNASKQLISFISETTSGGQTVTVSERAVRNSQGTIQQVIYKSPQYQQLGIDSAVSVIKSSAGKYTTEITDLNVGGIPFVDSVALIYDAAGKVIREEQYYVIMGAADTSGKTEYTYSGSNLATVKNYSWDGTTFNLDQTYTYDQYDTKVNPMYFGADAFVFGSPAFVSMNNPLKSTQTALGTTQNFATTYTYNSSNKPVTATSVVQPNGTVSRGTYYYQ
ncbi:MAG: hypothetical protein ACXVLT_12725 [Flavisolibacter sp.]